MTSSWARRCSCLLLVAAGVCAHTFKVRGDGRVYRLVPVDWKSEGKAIYTEKILASMPRGEWTVETTDKQFNAETCDGSTACHVIALDRDTGTYTVMIKSGVHQGRQCRKTYDVPCSLKEKQCETLMPGKVGTRLKDHENECHAPNHAASPSCS